MKKILCMLVIGMFLLAGCAHNNTMQGGGIGAGLGTIVSVIAGKSGETAALLIMGGALLGGVIGNAMDEQAKQVSMQPENRGKSVIVLEEGPVNAQTKCRKVTKRTWKDGNMVNNTTEEVCTGNQTTNTY